MSSARRCVKLKETRTLCKFEYRGFHGIGAPRIGVRAANLYFCLGQVAEKQTLPLSLVFIKT
jgi:hypothetical protein